MWFLLQTGTSVSKKRRTWSLPWRSTCRTLPSSTNLSSTIHACNAGDRSNGRRYRFEWPSRGTIADSSTAAKHSADSADLADGCERESRNSTKWMGLLVASVL